MEFQISTDKDRLDIQKVHEEVAATYWGKGRSMEETMTLTDNDSWNWDHIRQDNRSQIWLD